MMNHYSIAQLINCFVLGSLGLLVILRNYKSKIHLTFALHSFAGSYWTFAFFKMISAPDAEVALFWAQKLHWGAVWLPTFFLHFNCAILNLTQRFKRLLQAAYAISIILFFLVPTRYFVSHTPSLGGFTYFVGPAGWQYHIFSLFFAACVIFSIICLFVGFRRAEGLKRQQLRFLLVASLLGYTGGVFAFMPLFDVKIPFFAFYTISLYIGIFAFAISRYRLFDFENIVRKTLFYATTILLIFVTMLVTSYVYALVTGTAVSIKFIITAVATVSLVMVVMSIYQQHIENMVERLINKERREIYSSLNEITQSIIKNTNKDDLFEFITRELYKHLQLSNICIYQYDDVQQVYTYGPAYCRGETAQAVKTIDANNPVIDYIAATQDLVETDKLIHSHDNSAKPEHKHTVISFLEKQLKAALVLPILVKNTVMGLLVLGYPRDRIGFTEREIIILRNIVMETAIVLENIILHENINRNNRLEIIGTIASSFAHEIRNPLTSAKMIIEMLMDRYHDEKIFSKFKEIVPHEIDRVLELTTQLLNFSRFKEPEYATIEIEALGNKLQLLLNNEFTKKSSRLEVVVEGKPTIRADENQLYQVLLNLVLNALQAIETNGMIKLTLINQEDQPSIKLIMEDNGQGIRSSDLQRIFEPFYSTKIYGTGLGLATCKRIIEAHHGYISVESKEGKGTQFIISLPREPVAAKITDSALATGNIEN